MHSAATSARGSRLTGKNEGARLGGARADFVAGLGRRVADLRIALAAVKANTPNAAADLRKRLGSLASAAKMMKFEAMDRALGETLGKLDHDLDLDAVEQLVEDLPALAWGDGIARSSRAEQQEQLKSLPKREVLVVGSPQIAEALLGAVEHGRTATFSFSAEATPDVTAAYDLVRTTEPDLIVLDADIPNALDLVDALMDDPLTETVPIVVLGSFQEHGEASRYVAMGVAKTVAKPMTKAALRDVCEETLSPERGTLTAQAVIGEPTLEELADRLANEVRDAIVGRADPSARTRRIALGEGTEVLGAMWGAIARVREVVTARTDGAVRFGAGPEGSITPALLLHEPARADRVGSAGNAKRDASADVRLEGRRVVVADDDPAVVWFLADLLKTAGCEVLEAFDGRRALELAYESSPDLIISDILMPNLDGFSLCRAIRRDVALRDTPVILLSWKEDLLQRVRELGANASGYVRKESDTRAIIARVREALRGRARIETRLREDGEVRGRLDGVSIKTLLEAVATIRPDARVSVRDATFLYEVEVRGGVPRRITRTDSEGGFQKGKAMLTQMLGVGAGRFAVMTSTSTSNVEPEPELEGNLAAQLAKPIAKARAAISLLTGSRMNAVARVRFDEHALVDYLKATPEKPRLVARRLANGASPRELVLHGGCEASLLDDILCDLAARGLVIAIEGDNAEDLLTPAIEALLPHIDARADISVKNVTPPPVDSCADDAADPVCVSPVPSPASSVEEAVLREVEQRSPSPSPVKLLKDMFPFGSPSPMIVDPAALKPRQLTPSPTFYEATGTPPAEQILALGEATAVENTTYGSTHEEEDDVYHSDAIVPGVEEVEVPAEFTPFGVVTDDTPAEVPMAKRKAWPMLAFITATGIVAWAVLHFTSHPLGMPKQNQAEPPAAEMSLPATNVVKSVDQDRADDDFYKKQQGEVKTDDAPGAGKDAGAKTPKTSSNAKPDNVEGLSRLAHLAH